ncbi:MAG TPA: toll/interleukin-1 receptor domain-containing protein [Caulobacteraceae bacterium]|nr:toll/interleukin-1 receptor domain-containing protein [Caulobacteraceae bacterium]
MAYDVFISYSSKDKPAADAACAILEAQGIRCWIAPRDILPGQEWGASIVKAIADARIFVLLLSASANASPQISREVERAVNHGVPVIPVRLEDVTPTASLEYFINTPHWLDAFKPPLDDHLNYLARVVRTLMNERDAAASAPSGAPPASSPELTPPPAPRPAASSTPPAAAPAPAPAPAPAAPAPRRSALALLPLGLAVVALVLAGLALWKLAPRAGPGAASGAPSGLSVAPASAAPDSASQAAIAPTVDPSCLAQAPSQPSPANCQAMLNQSQTWEGCAASYAQADMPALAQRAQSLIDQGRSGVDLYDASPDFKAYGTISHYWEMLSQCVHEGELSYGDISSGLPFPDSFWNKTRPLRAVIGENWQGPNQGLPDFMSNFRYLCQQYKAGRNADRPGGGDSLDCSS